MSTPVVDPVSRFLTGYPETVLVQVRAQLADGRLGAYLSRNYPEVHAVRTDGALYAHAMALKSRHLRNAPVLAKVAYDNRLQIDQRALGTLTSVSRAQGGRLTAKRELRVAALFKDAPALMLEMIVVHELAHLKESEHNKPFYALCDHMLPGYHQIEFDTRLYLTWQTVQRAQSPQGAGSAVAP
jgi:predicted metal-dependent hydrolase